MNNDLLRPFNLEAAKRGEELCWQDGHAVTLLAEAGKDGYHALRFSSGNITLATAYSLYMKPLCWIEGHPVYKGDVLYSAHSGDPRTVKSIEDDRGVLIVRYEEETGYVHLEDCTWTKPEPVKKTRTVKFLCWMTTCDSLLWQAEGCQPYAGYRRVPSEDKTAEVEE